MSSTITGSFSEKNTCSSIQCTINKLLDFPLFCFYLFVKLVSFPINFMTVFITTIVQFVAKIAKIFLTFVITGIQGVQRTFRIGAFAQKIHYAVLKQNGQYLKLGNKTLQQIFTCQLYDYGIRKFMSLSQIEQDLKISQIQFWSPVGLNFLKNKFGIKNLSALTNSRQKINRFKYKLKQISLDCSDYSGDSTSNPQDVFIFFNRSKQQQEHKLQIDMIKVLGYIKKNLNQNGYAIVGNYFNYDGDVGVFEEILEGFGFKIQMKQDITPNINHSRRVLTKIYKNRKLAWAGDKIRQVVQLAYEHNNRFSNTIRSSWNFLQQLAGVKICQNSYHLYILQHAS